MCSGRMACRSRIMQTIVAGRGIPAGESEEVSFLPLIMGGEAQLPSFPLLSVCHPIFSSFSQSAATACDRMVEGDHTPSPDHLGERSCALREHLSAPTTSHHQRALDREHIYRRLKGPGTHCTPRRRESHRQSLQGSVPPC